MEFSLLDLERKKNKDYCIIVTLMIYQEIENK